MSTACDNLRLPAEDLNPENLTCTCLPVDVPGDGPHHAADCKLAIAAKSVVDQTNQLIAELKNECDFTRMIVELIITARQLGRESIYQCQERQICLECRAESATIDGIVHEPFCVAGKVLTLICGLVKLVEGEENPIQKEDAAGVEGRGAEVGKLQRNPARRGVNALFEGGIAKGGTL